MAHVISSPGKPVRVPLSTSDHEYGHVFGVPLTTALAVLICPLREPLDGMSVGIVVCGANIDPESFARNILPG